MLGHHIQAGDAMNDDLQAPMPTDHACRRRAFLLIFLIYVAALLVDALVADWSLISGWFQ